MGEAPKGGEMNHDELLDSIRKIVREEIRREFPLPHFNQDELNQMNYCLHEGLPKDRTHMIVCPCPKCSPRC
jgi:hypothetical protein